MNSKIFKVAPGRIVWSEKFQKHFHEGEILDLSHASDADIAPVLLSGAIVPASVEEVEDNEEVHDG